MVLPSLTKQVKKGQKISLGNSGDLTKLDVRIGWNIKNPNCDVDVSAFMLAGNRVISDDWFVFYGQKVSPDGSTVLSTEGSPDREVVSIDLTRLNPSVEKIVFVVTINEALLKHLNFSMLKDTYVRVMNPATNTELVSFILDEYYANVTSMMVGEVYKHNGQWKFNAIGNGVARDLAGLCEFYGVQVE
ncbi:MAG: TerD family protein [Eubacterium sp.]|nr:TerD family protein [Eubacterium sp.]